MSDFAKNLRYYRKQKRLSQAELAKALNYGDTTISNYESGRNEPSFDDLINLSHKLSVTPNDLIGFSFMDKDISFLFRFNQLETKHKKIILDLIQALLFLARLRPSGACAANLFADAPTRVAFSLQKSLFYAIIEQKL